MKESIKSILLGILIIVGLVIVIVLGALIFYSPIHVKDYELVMIYNSGILINEPLSPGFHMYSNFLDSIQRFDTRQKTLIIIDKPSPDVGAVVEPKGVGAITRDGIKIGVIVRIFYTLNKDKGKIIIDNFGSDDSKESRTKIEQKIDAKVRESIQSLVPQYYLQYLLENRNELVQNIYCVFDKNQKPEEGDQLNEAGEKILVSPPLPQNGERLSDIGIDVKQLTLEFDVSKEILDVLNRIGANTLSMKEEEQKLVLIKKQKETANLAIDLSKLKSQISTIEIETKNKLPVSMQFIEKWSGNLPMFLVINGDLTKIFK